MRLGPLAIGIAALSMAYAGPVAAQNGDEFTAIAYSTTTHAVGYAYDARSQQEAEAAALARCGEHADDCESRNWSRNACSALAVTLTGDGGWGAAWGDTYTEAAEGAYNTCREFNDSCQVYAWVCNSSATP